MKTLLKIIIVLVIIFLLIPPAIYLYFKSAKPRDLGIRYTPADYQATHTKFGVEVGTLSSANSVKDSLQYTGSKEAKLDLNSTEITAYLNASKWVYAPGSSLQVKINSDGTGEIAGLLDIPKFISYISLTTPTAEIKDALNKYKIPLTAPFYAKGTLNVVNNHVTLNVQTLEVSRLPVPASKINENITAINNYATDRLNSIPNLQVRSLTLTNGQAHLDATIPAKVLKLEK